MGNVYAQCIKINGEEVCGPANFMGGASDVTIGLIISSILKLLMPLAGILLFIYLVMGGYDFLLSMGNPEKIKSAKGKITNALIGFFLLIFSYLLVRLIAKILNLGVGLF